MSPENKVQCGSSIWNPSQNIPKSKFIVMNTSIKIYYNYIYCLNWSSVSLKYQHKKCIKIKTFLPTYPNFNQLNVSHFVIQCQLLPSWYSANYCHRTARKYHTSNTVPSERLRLVKQFILHRLHTGAWGNLVLLTYLLTYLIFFQT